MKSIGEDLRTYLESSTGLQAGLEEVPVNVTTPFYNVRSYPGPEMSGSMGIPNSIDDQVFMIDVVGSSMDQVDRATQRMIYSLRTFHSVTTGVMGPPMLRRNGIGREDDRTYRGMVVATISVTETEEV